MPTVTVKAVDSVGNETVATHDFQVESGFTPISGNFAGTIGPGEHAHITGNVNLTGDLIVEGLLTGIDTFTLEGNGFQVLFQNGGRPDLAGVEKSAWIRWGETPIGWQTGDRVAVAPTAAGVYVPSEILWGAARPANSPDVTLPNGSIARPEVANLTQTIVFKNLRRIHFHDGAGVASLKWLKVLNCGTAGVLADYPIHFHLNGEASRGSLIESVVVEGGKNHAFVPHGSHGITLRDCVAYNMPGGADPWWWDVPLSKTHTANNSNDIAYQHVLGMWMRVGSNAVTGAGFLLGAGSGNSVVDSTMTCLQGGKDAAGFQWPADANFNVGGNQWIFRRNVSHNNKNDGIFVWQNDDTPHEIEDFTAYRNGRCQIDHGAYSNHYLYKRGVLMGGSEGAFRLHAQGPILIEDYITDGPLLVHKHAAGAAQFAIVRRCQFTSVIYTETDNGGDQRSWVRYEDCGLIPASFNLAGIVSSSVIEITEGGLLTHRWAGGWT